MNREGFSETEADVWTVRREPGSAATAYTAKLSNGTVPKGIGKDSQELRTALEKQQSCPEEADILVCFISLRAGKILKVDSEFPLLRLFALAR